MKIIDTIKESATKYTLSAIFGILILLIGAIYQDLLPILYPEVIQNLPKEVFLKITTLAILLFVLSSVLSLFYYLKSRTKLIPKCGILWDKNKEPYCTACEKPLSEYYFSDPYYGFRCIQCDKDIRLMHDTKPISLPEAQKLLKS